MDMPHRGILELTGRDRLPFLNNLLTNETWNKETKTPLAKNTGVYAFFLNNKGRIAADMNVLELGDCTLLEMDARMVAPTMQAFEKYIFAEQVKLTNRADTFHQLLLCGPKSGEVLKGISPSPGTLGEGQGGGSLPLPQGEGGGEGLSLPLLASIQLNLLNHP